MEIQVASRSYEECVPNDNSFDAYPLVLEEADFLSQFTNPLHLEHVPVPEPSTALRQASALGVLARLAGHARN